MSKTSTCKIVMIYIVGCFLLTAVNLNPVFAQDTRSQSICEKEPDCVKKLRCFYKTDRGFKKNIDLAFKNLHDMPGSIPNPWQGLGFEDLCKYFTKWYHFLPEPGQGLDYISCFSWFYYKNDYGMKFVTEKPGSTFIECFVKARGEYMDTPVSKAPRIKKVIDQWMTELDMSDFIVPDGGFKTFNEFFTRKIKPGTRPISDPTDDSVIVSPVDALVNMIDNQLTLEKKLHVKHNLYLNVKQLLNHSRFAKNFKGGTAVSCILMPNIYHHYHAPVTGKIVESDEDVVGNYFGIKDFIGFFHGGDVGYDAPYNYFEHFRRGYFIIKTKAHGFVAVIPVGLNTISSVVFNDKYKGIKPDKPVPVYKGDELGYFQYGGSLVILLFEPGVYGSVKILQGARMGVLGTPAKKGEKPKPPLDCDVKAKE